MSDLRHEPVMPAEVMEYLAPGPGDVAVDGTVGLGGHSELLGTAIGPEGILVALDWDEEMLERAKDWLSKLECRMHFVHSDFRQLSTVMGQLGNLHGNCILLDLGVNSVHLDVAELGFSFNKEGPLDMRMDRSTGETAAEKLAHLSEKEIERIIRDYGEERWSKAIAKRIVERRGRGAMQTTTDLVEAVAAAIPVRARDKRIHFATRTFQGIRCAVTGELVGLQEAIERAIDCLAPGGRIAVLAYHSLEDRQVKRAFARMAGKCDCPPGLPECRCGAQKKVVILTSKPLRPTEEEVRRNPRSRSAKLRAARRI